MLQHNVASMPRHMIPVYNKKDCNTWAKSAVEGATVALAAVATVGCLSCASYDASSRSTLLHVEICNRIKVSQQKKYTQLATYVIFNQHQLSADMKLPQ